MWFLKKNLHDNNPIKTIDYSASLGLRLGLDKKLASGATIRAIGHYGIAVVDRELPEDFGEISFLTKATEIDNFGGKLVNFSPIVFHSVYGNDFL